MKTHRFPTQERCRNAALAERGPEVRSSHVDEPNAIEFSSDRCWVTGTSVGSVLPQHILIDFGLSSRSFNAESNPVRSQELLLDERRPMTNATRLPRTFFEWICLFGPGAIMASLTIGTGELVFSTRGGALFGYRILFVFTLISLLKWILVVSTSRHMVLTGVHPYERLIDLPGPRGWMPIMLLLMSIVCLPVWITFHSSVMGNLLSWVTGTRGWYDGGGDYIWGVIMLTMVIILSATGGYEVLEKSQTVVVLAMVACACLTLVLYQPDWLQLIMGLIPQRLEYPDWLPETYPEIARHSEWVETTRYMGVIGGAGFDYLAYTSWLREKEWGVLPGRATERQLQEIADDPHHDVRRWVNAPFVDCAISFLLVIVFSAVFVASGAMFLGPAHVVPDENNLLNLQARFVTQIHPWLLPLYIVGAFLTMLGTLYGTLEVACNLTDEIVRSFYTEWTKERARRLRAGTIAWCATVAFVILAWFFIRHTGGVAPDTRAASATSKEQSTSGQLNDPTPIKSSSDSAPQKPRLLLTIMTPVNLFTGVLFCGLICLSTVWMDQRWLPAGLRPSAYFTGFNIIAGVLFLALGIKGYWENENRVFASLSMLGLFAASVLIAWLINPSRKSS